MPSTRSAWRRTKAGKIPGIYCRDAERALAMAKRGFRFITVGSDQGFLREGTAAQVKALKDKARQQTQLAHG